MFSYEFCPICNNTYIAKHNQTAASDDSSSVVVRGELANETVNYNTETGAYQFKQEVPVMKKCSPGQKTGLTLVRRSLINARFN